MTTMTNQPTPDKNALPEKSGKGSYMKEAGNKTLILFSVILLLIITLTITTLVLMNRNASILILSF